MKPFDIFIAYVSWNGGGKRRPVLIFSRNADRIKVFRITTQYENKSPAIQAKYFKINDWKQAGLNKQSYVDTVSNRNLSLSVIKNTVPTGRLTNADKQRLIMFLTQ